MHAAVAAPWQAEIRVLAWCCNGLEVALAADSLSHLARIKAALVHQGACLGSHKAGRGSMLR